MTTKFTSTLLFLILFSALSVVYANDGDYYCRADPPNLLGELGSYRICRKCPSLDQDCESEATDCQCDDIEILKKGRGRKPSEMQGGSNCQTKDRKGKKWCYVSSTSKCEDKKTSRVANKVRKEVEEKKQVFFHKNKIFFSNDACENVDFEPGVPLATGNEQLLYGYKIVSDDLKYRLNNETEEFVKLWFHLDSPDDCQHDCQERRGLCGAWSYDFSTQTCYLHNVDACCQQFTKREENQDFVSGYTCTSCWTTKAECSDEFCPLKLRQFGLVDIAQGAGGRRPTHFTATGGLAVRPINNPNRDDPCKCKWVPRRPKGYRCKKPRGCE